MDNDEEIGLTDTPHHVMVYDKNDSDYLDFSNVLNDANILETEDLGSLAGEVDQNLLDTLSKKLSISFKARHATNQ